MHPIPVPVAIGLNPPASEDNPTQVECIGHVCRPDGPSRLVADFTFAYQLKINGCIYPRLKTTFSLFPYYGDENVTLHNPKSFPLFHLVQVVRTMWAKYPKTKLVQAVSE